MHRQDVRVTDPNSKMCWGLSPCHVPLCTECEHLKEPSPKSTKQFGMTVLICGDLNARTIHHKKSVQT